MSTNLSKSDTKIKVVGILADKNLEQITDKNGNAGVRGSVSIKVDDLNTIRFKVYVGQKTNKGVENKAWAGIQTVLNEYKSIPEVGIDAADKVVVSSGTFDTYKNQNGADVTTYSSNFFSRVNGNFVPERTFQAECFIKAKSWEVDSEGNETGRLKIKAISPTFNGINILDLIAPKETDTNPNFANEADGLFEIGNTYKINGEIVNSRVEKTVKAALGTLKGETEYKNELIVVGSSSAYDEEKAYDAEAIKLAIQNYEDTQAQRQSSKEKIPSESKPSAEKMGRAGLSF